MMSKTFKGANVFLSRNLVPPEIFDSLHDVLKHNGADVYLCCDPSRNGPNDYHVISSNHHEKFDDLQKKGCCMLGPQCVFSSAKECRPLPKQCFTCCLAMDGVKVLASGFEMDEKLEIGKMVTAMGGAEHTKASLDVSFVIVKNVLAAKYKWALNVLKKPVVTLSWLHQCWKEHRVVPHEAYRVLPFSGLMICVTKVPAVERKEMEKVVVQNGGNYSAELTRKCTHLVSPEGDKYKVAKRWGNVLTVTRRWFDQSVARRACLNEESYPVQGGSALLPNGVRTCLSAPHSQDKWVGGSQFVSSSAGDSNLETLFCTADQDLEVRVSQKVSTTYLEGPIYHKEVREVPAVLPRSDTSLDGCVADDSQTEDDDLYLADCRILLCGFDASEMRKLVNMVRRGGGSRYMSMNEKLTHIIVGTLSEIEKKEVRGLAAAGVIYVVRPAWLEDCDREKKEAPVLRGHIAYDLLLPKDSICLNKGATVETATMKHFKVSTVQSGLRDDNLQGTTNSGAGTLLEKNNGLEVNINVTNSMKAATRSDTQGQFNAINGKGKDDQKTQVRSCDECQDMKSSVFVGRLFRFGSSFPQDRRAEIIEWIYLGGGEVVEDQTKQKVHFVVGCHGVIPHSIDASGATNVSSHWIRSCLEDRCLLDIPSHIIYSPLPCRIPLPGFERFRFCISQYDEKDRLLMRNLCFILGAKFVEKLTKKVTHLLCKFTSGPKYEAACKWGIQSVTCEWIYECVKQNEIVSIGPFCPKEVTSEDQMAGNCTLSQYPTQATKMIASQFAYESKDLGNIQASTSDIGREDRKLNSNCCKRARTLEDECELGQQFSGLNQSDFLSRMTYTGTEIIEKTKGVSDAVPDVAAAIEDLLEQTSKIHDLKSPGRNKCDKSLFSSDCSVLVQEHVDSRPTFGLTDHWINRSNRKSDSCNFSEDANVGIYDGFSETQTESQVVGYEEDLSGRQMIIDRVRTRSSKA